MTNVFVALDTKNLLRACKGQFGKSYRISYQKMTDTVLCLVDQKDKVNIIAYVSTSNRIGFKDASFVSALRDLGCGVIKQMIMPRVGLGFEVLSESDNIAGITTDALRAFHESNCDHFIIVTGDNDFRYLLRDLMERGVRVGIISFHHPSIYEKCANYAIEIDKTLAFSVSRRHFDEEDSGDDNKRFKEDLS